MKTRISILLLLLSTFVAPAQGLKYSQYPQTNIFHGGFLILWADPGKTNYAQSGSDLIAQITSLGNFTTTNINVTYITNFYGYITNLFSTTEYVTNIFVLSLTNAGVAASSAVITDSHQVETNAVNAHGVFTNTASGPPSFGLLQNTELKNSTVNFSGTSGRITGGGSTALGATATPFDLASGIVSPGTYRSVTADTYGRVTAGTTPTTFSGYGISDSAANLFLALTTYDFSSATNLTYKYTTNIVGAANFVFGKAYWTNASSNFTFPALTMQDNAAMETLAVWVTNSGGSTITATINGVAGAPGHVVPAVFYCTNATVTEIDVSHFGVLWTNACVSKN